MTTAALQDRDVERIAWTVLVCSFAACLVLFLAVPSSAYWFANTATDGHETNLTVLSGTVIVELPGRDPSGEQKTRMVPEGATIRTDSNTRVSLTLFDGSAVIVLPDSAVTLNAVRSPKFPVSSLPAQMSLALHGGRLRLAIAPDEHPVEFRVDTPHGTADFARGNFSIEVADEQTDVVVRDGQSLIHAHDTTLALHTRERGQLRPDEKPRGPFAAQRDLIVNGQFSGTLNDAWRAYNDQGGDGGSVDGIVQVLTEGPRVAVRFARKDSKGDHDDTGVEQILNKDVTDAEIVRLKMDVRVNVHSLSGCGYVSTECPLMVRIRYRDVNGGERIWVHGFFAQNPDGKALRDAEQVPQGLWYPYESEDLTDILSPKLAQVLSIQIFASGWDFDSMVSDVGLIVE